jgi:hypothetical protein
MTDGKHDMNTLSFGWKVTSCGAALLVLGSFAVPEPAHAQFGINIGGLIRAFGGGVRFKGGGGPRKHEKGDSSDDSSSDNGARKSRDDRVLASLGAPSSQRQTQVLMSITPGDVLGVVGSKQDTQQKLGQTRSKDDDRDWTGEIVTIAKRFRDEQDKGDGKRSATTAGDVTEHAIEQSLDAAYKKAKLDTFESFIGENWTAERLRKAILVRVEGDLNGMFVGNNRGTASMQQVDTMIQRAADATYRRIFELSELLASNKSSALFVQRLYQTHGNQVNGQVGEVADTMIVKAAAAAAARFEGPMRRDENGVALHYRAERIVYDCLSENVDDISSSSSSSGMATPNEIEERIEKVALDDCGTWLENQFGTQARSLTPQKPMPMRVIWSARGPKDDPSMYSQTRGAF